MVSHIMDPQTSSVGIGLLAKGFFERDRWSRLRMRLVEGMLGQQLNYIRSSICSPKRRLGQDDRVEIEHGLKIT